MNKVTFGSNQYCGPSVISAICGINTDTAAQVIKQVTYQRGDVKGVYSKDLVTAFNRLGYDCKSMPDLAGRSLFSTMYDLREDGMYVLSIPGHFITIEVNGSHKFICDNHTKEPINVAHSARLSQKVNEVIKVEKQKVIEPVIVPRIKYRFSVDFELEVPANEDVLSVSERIEQRIRSGFSARDVTVVHVIEE